MDNIQMEGQSEAHKPHWPFIIVLIVILLLVVVFWGGGSKTATSEYIKATNAPAENPGLTGVSDEYRAGIEAARVAPATK